MCSSKLSILLLYTLSITLIFRAPLASSDEVDIEDLCNGADSTGFTDGATINDCFNFLNSNPKYQSADYQDISKFIIEYAINKEWQDQNTFHELAKKHSSEAIAKCSNVHYPSTVSFFRSALTHLDSDTDGAYHDALLARDGIEQCNGMVYDEKKLDANATATILDMNKIMGLFSDISTAAIYLYSNDHPPKKV